MRHAMGAHPVSSYGDVNAAVHSTVTRTMWGIAIVWFVVAATLAASGRLAEYSRVIGPFVVTPVIVFALAFAVSPRVRAWAFAFETRTLVTAQTVRVGGIAFLAVYAVGRLNGKFAVWAGLLDCIVGFSAPFAGHYLTPLRTTKQRDLLCLLLIRPIGSRRPSHVFMMESTDARHLHHPAVPRPLNRPMLRRVFRQG